MLPCTSKLSSGVKGNIGPKVLPAIKGKESPDFSGKLDILIHSFIHSLILPSGKTGRGNSDPAQHSPVSTLLQRRQVSINKCKSVSRVIEGGHPVLAGHRITWSLETNRLPGPALDH